MFGILSSLLKYIFITIIYIFLFAIIRLIYLDIRLMNNKAKASPEKAPYLKLINRRDNLNYKVEESYILDRGKKIGRSNKNDIAIQDPYLSNQHAELLSEDGQYSISDLGSKNGVSVNNKVIGGPVCLKNGDKIQLGQLSFMFVNDDD